MVQALRADGSLPTVDPEAEITGATDMAYQNLYDVARSDLVEHFESHTKALLTDPDPSVRRAFLGSVSSLCVFFGSPKANDVVLSHLNTYLNDKDWQLKCAFFQTIVGVATFVGSSSLEDFILPLMVQALTDQEEFVVEKVLSSFASMAGLGLFQRARSWEMVDVVARFMMHPNIWIREAATHFISAATKYLSIADTHCIILPLIRPYLKTTITEFSEIAILDALKTPLPRPILDMAIVWSQKADRGLFWRNVQDQRTFSFGGVEQAVPIISPKDLSPNALRKVPKNDEDEQWLTRLRNLGMEPEDEFKLLALRDYIHLVASKKSKEPATVSVSPLKNIVKLQDLNITPQTIFFENNTKNPPKRRARSSDTTQKDAHRNKPHTIADALLDASTTIDERPSRRDSSRSGLKEQLNGEPRTLPVPAARGNERGQSSILLSPLSSSPSTRVGSYDGIHPMSAQPKPFTRTHTRLNPNEDVKSDGTLTPTDSIGGPAGKDRLRVRHKSSAISLLNRRDMQKTIAEIGTDATNAVGELDTPFVQEGTDGQAEAPVDRQDKPPSLADIQPGHTYDGGDPNVTKLLDSLAAEYYPIDELDFGPFVTPISRRSLKRSDSIDGDGPWRPQGIHVATFGEHNGAITRLLPSPDHVFFITASDDGTVKIWDTLRLERNLIHRSRQTHKHAEGAEVTCVTFVENTNTFVSCASDGSVHVVKVECSFVGDTTKYGKLRVKRRYQLPPGEHAVWCEHFRSEAKSMLMLATNSSRVIALDLRTMVVQYVLTNPLQYGAPTCFCLDRKRNWLLLGTTHGILSFFDLRFRLNVKAWCLAGRNPIHRLTLHPFKGRGRWVCIAGGTGLPDITVWDVEKTECREVYRAAASEAAVAVEPRATKDITKPYQPLPISHTKLLSSPEAPPPTDHAVRAFAIGVDAPSSDDREAKHGFLLTGGADRRVRFWDLARVEASVVVSGLRADEAQPRFASSRPTPGLVLNMEKGGARGEAEAGRKDKDRDRGAAYDRDRPKEKGRSKGGESRVVAMAREQKALLRNHLDSVTDVTVLEGGVGMVVSVDRKGCVYVFQ